MALSTHKVEVIPVVLRKHDNADSLSIVDAHGGFPVCVKTADWVGVDRGAYIPPDTVVDLSRPEFAFLKSGEKVKHRVKAKKLRGVVSFGLLMPAPEGSNIGDDVTAFYGVEHYEPPMRGGCSGGEAEAAPPALSCLPKYDVDGLRRYRWLFADDELVQVTEKIHGANSRFAYMDGRMWCGSRTEWKREDAGNLWWKALASTRELEYFCRDNAGFVVYGEVYGAVQSLRYGCRNGEVRFAAFDLLQPDGTWMAATESRVLLDAAGVPQVPLLGVVPYKFGYVCRMAEGPSAMPGAEHIREGCVVKPLAERQDLTIGRVQLKVVGGGFLERD